MKLVKDAVGKGAEVVFGALGGEDRAEMTPIVLYGVMEEMGLYKTESIGPTVTVIEVNTKEEGLRIANDTEYGLSSLVLMEDLGRG